MDKLYEGSGEILIEGMTSVSAIINAIMSGVSDRAVKCIYISCSAKSKKSRELSFIMHNSSLLGYEVKIIGDNEFNALVSGSTHGGIAALCTERTFGQVTANNIPVKGLYALLDGIEDPYNYAYSVRSLYAAGFDGIVLTPRNWTSAGAVVIKSSAGTTELMPTFADDPVRAVTCFREAGYRVISAGIRDSVSLYEADLSAPLLLIIGGEKRGISRSLLALSDTVVRIDYGRSFIGSLTTASSTAVIAFEIMRRNK